MDVNCANCREPWDNHHMREDEPWELWDGMDGSESHLMVKKFLADPNRTLTDELTAAFKERGWVFAGSIYAIMRCCCCPEGDALPGGEGRGEAIAMLAESLGDDQDGLISTLNDFEWAGMMDDF